jgi:hypothetical protein
VTTPDAAAIREWSKLDFDSLSYSDDVDLQRILDQAISYVWFVTGRKADTNLPADFEGLMRQAIQMRTEQVAYLSQESLVETITDGLQSFSAGAYSESRLDPTSMAKLINPWPDLNSVLWMLMTEEKRDYWNERLLGINAPAWEVTSVDWSGRYFESLPLAFGDPYPPKDFYGLP